MWPSVDGVPVLLAPMAGVGDIAFRSICKAHGCDFTFTEMVSAKGLHYKGAKTKALLNTSESERPCGVQIFGSDPEIMAETAEYICNEHADDISVIDINMGCPVNKIVSNGEGAALMKQPLLAANIIEAVVKKSTLPVTVKFRKGWDEDSVNAVEFARMAEQSGAAGIAVHGRTRQQMYAGRADWDIIAQVKAAVKIPVAGNGDVFSGADAKRMLEATGCDAVMVARGAQGNPWIFEQIKAELSGQNYQMPGMAERLDTALCHARMLEKYIGKPAIAQMRKHIAWYSKGMPDAAKLRQDINTCASLNQLEDILLQYKHNMLMNNN